MMVILRALDMNIRNAYTYALIGLLMGCTTGCNRHETFKLVNERKTYSEQEFEFLTPDFEDRSLVLTLDDIINIALERNLDIRVKLQEAAIQHEKATGEAFTMLPALTASGVTSWRNRSTASTQIQNGVVSSPIVSSPQRVEQWDVTATWNLLDFGVSYYRARQEHNREIGLLFQYQRQSQNLILDIYKSYWKGVMAQRAIKDSQYLIEVSTRQTEDIEKQMHARNLPEIAGLKTETLIADMRVKVNKYASDYEASKAELAGLMGLSPFVCFELAPVDITEVNIELGDMCELEELALNNRPELFAADRDEKISADEVRISVLELAPNASLFSGRNYDANPFLVHHFWNITGVRASWNLLGMPQRFAEIRQARAKTGLAKESRLALSVGVMSQVHLANIKYTDSLENYKLANNLAVVSERLAAAARKTKKYGEYSWSDLMIYEVGALISRIDALKAYGELRVSIELLNNSIGIPRYFSLSQEHVVITGLGI